MVREPESENRDYINVRKRYVDIRARKSRLTAGGGLRRFRESPRRLKHGELMLSFARSSITLRIFGRISSHRR